MTNSSSPSDRVEAARRAELDRKAADARTAAEHARGLRLTQTGGWPGVVLLAALAGAAVAGVAVPWWVVVAATLVCALAAARDRGLAGRGRDGDGVAEEWRGTERRASAPEFDGIVAVCKRAARGDLGARVIPLPEDPRARQLAMDVNHMLDITDAFVREVGGALRTVAAGKHYRTFLPHGLRGDFGRAAENVNASTQKMAGRMVAFQRVTDKFEARLGGLSTEIAEAAVAIGHTARRVGEVAGEARAGAGGIAESADAALRNVEAVAAAARRMDGAMGGVSGRASESAEVAQRAVAETRAAADAVKTLSAAARRIDEVVQLIKGVSDYTKLLAVNASVEAARAGPAGRGFAVVASEVQSLAAQTADATQEVAEQIRAVQSGVSTAVAAIGSISSTIDLLADGASEMSSAIAEQRGSIRGVTDNMSEAADGSRSVAGHVEGVGQAIAATDAAAQEVLSAAHALTAHAEALRLELDGYLEEAKAA